MSQAEERRQCWTLDILHVISPEIGFSYGTCLGGRHSAPWFSPPYLHSRHLGVQEREHHVQQNVMSYGEGIMQNSQNHVQSSSPWAAATGETLPRMWTPAYREAAHLRRRQTPMEHPQPLHLGQEEVRVPVKASACLLRCFCYSFGMMTWKITSKHRKKFLVQDCVWSMLRGCVIIFFAHTQYRFLPTRKPRRSCSYDWTITAGAELYPTYRASVSWRKLLTPGTTLTKN